MGVLSVDVSSTSPEEGEGEGERGEGGISRLSRTREPPLIRKSMDPPRDTEAF